MTNTELAVLAIKGIGTVTNMNGGRVLDIMQALKLSTEEASEVRNIIRREWLAGNDDLDFAREYVNRYVRDPRFR
jgi:hypothetical protein